MRADALPTPRTHPPEGTLVFIHGRQGSSEQFERIAEAAGTARRFAYDWHGGSLTPWRGPGFAAASRRSTDWSAEVPGARNVHIGGGHEAAFEDEWVIAAIARRETTGAVPVSPSRGG